MNDTGAIRPFACELCARSFCDRRAFAGHIAVCKEGLNWKGKRKTSQDARETKRQAAEKKRVVDGEARAVRDRVRLHQNEMHVPFLHWHSYLAYTLYV